MFNLIDEPWLPVHADDGARQEVSLRDVYRTAPNLAELALEFPLEHVAVTRMLVAVLQSALGGPSGVHEKSRWLGDHGGCVEAIDRYLDTWHHRFELFDPERPFMQQVIGEKVEKLPIAELRPDFSSGHNAVVFDHRADAQPAPMDPGVAARALLVTLAYQPGGGRPPRGASLYRTDGPCTRLLVAIIDGDDMWETLIANSPVVHASDGARPIWERDVDHRPGREGTAPLGWLDRLTWRSRAVQLVRDEDGAVRQCRLHQHLKIADGPPFDPFMPIRRREGKPPSAIRPLPSRAVWRDAESLLRGLAADDTASPVVADAVLMFERLEPPRFPRLRVVGQVVVKNARIADVRQARLPVSAALLRDEERLDLVALLVERAEAGTKALWVAIKVYADELGDGEGWAFASRWETPVWAALAGPFRDALAVLAEADEPPLGTDPVVVQWLAVVRSECKRSFAALASAASSSPRQTRALALAHDRLQSGLSKITPGKEES